MSASVDVRFPIVPFVFRIVNADEILRDQYLPVRADLLTVAATLDRIDRAGGGSNDADALRMRRTLSDAIAIIANGPVGGRAEKLQRLFSDAYDPDWIDAFGLREAVTAPKPNDAPEAG